MLAGPEAARGWGFWGRVGAFPDGLRGFGGRAPNRRRHAEGEARRFLTLKRLWRH